ncbi:MAG: pilus assembly protein TadG-related protein [Gemmatimonadaceae bacterium]
MTTVLVAVLMTVLLGFGAFAVDLSQRTTYKTELQRSADVAALAGAVQLLNTTSYQDADDSASAFSARNPVMGQAPTVNGIDYGTWTGLAFAPYACNPACAAADVVTANAIRARVSGSGTPILGGFVGATNAFTLPALAVAWVAINASNCVKPWGVPYATYQSWIAQRGLSDPPTAAQLKALSNAQREFILKQAAQGNNQGFFQALNLPQFSTTNPNYVIPPRNNNGADQYRDNILNIPGQCQQLFVGDMVQTKRGDMAGPTIQGVSGFQGNPGPCAYLLSGSCYNEAGQIGQAVTLALYSDAVSAACQNDPNGYQDDRDNKGVLKCVRVERVVQFVLTKVVETGQKRSELTGVFVGQDISGPVRTYAQRPILVQ